LPSCVTWFDSSWSQIKVGIEIAKAVFISRKEQEQAFALWLSEAKIACLQHVRAREIYVAYANAHSSAQARW
jgi:hypothetical protein